MENGGNLVVFVGGVKGGTGKSFVSMLGLHAFISKGIIPTLVETDTSNPDVYKTYQKKENEADEKGKVLAYNGNISKLWISACTSQYIPPSSMNISIPSNDISLVNIGTCEDVVGSRTIAEDKPICILIISAPASIASKINCAIYPIIAPTTKFKVIDNSMESFAATIEGTLGLKKAVSINVNIKANASFTIPGISFLLNIGAILIKPIIRAKTYIPDNKYPFKSGNILNRSV